jgi:AraC-like DNA-binding protein
MSQVTENLSDKSIISRFMKIRGVKAPHIESRPWLEGLPVCQALAQYQMAHVGTIETQPPTRIVRTRQTTAYFLACYGGKGRVLIDGRWRVCRKGQACLQPAHTLNAFETIPHSRWAFCGVCYRQPPGQPPLGGATAPVLARYHVEPLRLAISGLIDECSGAAQPAMIQHWADLVEGYVRRFMQSSDQPDQLRSLWERVAASPAAEWSLTRLAQESGYSTTHLHRLCLRQLGRSPMRQVIYLRMRRAAELLASTGRTIEAVAHEVGYQNPFVFSNTFTKWIGWRPSEYRRTKQSKV